MAEEVPDLADVRGHNGLILGLEVAAAGGHNLFLQGPPGTGKTMIARRLPSILPPLSPDEAIEVTRIQSIAGLARRAPASSASARSARRTTRSRPPGSSAAPTRPSPARRRSPTAASCSSTSCREFSRPSLEALRQPLEDGHVTIVRGQQVMVFPTRFMLVAASNPCPCGLGGTRCQCTQADLARHRRRLSGPLLDRIDILMRVERPPSEALRRQAAPASATVRERVVAARERQERRLAGAARDLQRPAHLPPDPRARQRHPERPPPARRALRPPLASPPAATPASSASPAPSPTSTRSDVVGPEHVNIAASLRLDDSPPLAEAA